MAGIPYQSRHRLLIEFRCSFRSLFNTRLQAGRTKSIRVGALIETYSPVLVLDLEYHKTKLGHYSTGHRKPLMAFEGEDWCTEDIPLGRNVGKRLEESLTGGRQMGQNIIYCLWWLIPRKGGNEVKIKPQYILIFAKTSLFHDAGYQFVFVYLISEYAYEAWLCFASICMDVSFTCVIF